MFLKTHQIESKLDLLPSISFFLIYPCFLIYHLLAKFNYINSFLGGYFTGISIVIVPILFLFYSRNNHILKNRNSLFFDRIFIFYILYYLGIIYLGFLRGADENLVSSDLAYIFKFLIIFYTIRALNFDNPKFKALLFFIYRTVTLFIVFVFNGTPYIGNSEALNYAALSYVYTVISIYTVGIEHRKFVKRITYIASLFALFFIGARSEFIAFFIFILIIEFCITNNKLMYIILILCLTIGLAIIFYTFTNYLNAELPVNRMSNLLQPSNDVSFNTRNIFLENAMNILNNEPLWGNYGTYKTGTYAHNLLSVWVDMGIIGFVLFCSVLFLPLLQLCINFTNKSKSINYQLVLSTSVFSIFLFITSKYYNYLMFPVVSGLYSRYLSNSNNSS